MRLQLIGIQVDSYHGKIRHGKFKPGKLNHFII